MTRSLLTLFAFIIGSATLPAKANNFTGADALQGCVDMLSAAENPKAAGNFADGLTAGYCVGFMEGTRMVTKVTEIFEIDKLVCIPSYVNEMQVVSAVANYLQNNPERITDSASSTLLAALTKKYPCS